MKLTKVQLQRLIKEEVACVQENWLSRLRGKSEEPTPDPAWGHLGSTKLRQEVKATREELIAAIQNANKVLGKEETAQIFAVLRDDVISSTPAASNIIPAPTDIPSREQPDVDTEPLESPFVQSARQLSGIGR